MKNVRAMLLAAGLGTRLKSLSDERPKPMLPVCNQPLVRWAACLCRHHGIEDILVNLHHLGEQVQAELGDGVGLGARVTYSPEPEILGTGGGVKAMARLRPRGTILVMNAKIVCDIDLAAVLAEHRRSRALATMVLKEDPHPERWGAVGLDEAGRVVRLLDARRSLPPAGPGTRRDGASGDFMFTGIHLLEPELIEAIPDGPCCIIRTAYSTLFQRGAPLSGYVHRGYFQEHSTPARYLQGNFNLLDGLALPPGRPGPLRGISPSAEVSPRSRVEEPVLVGAGARIEADAEIGPRVVIGDGARIAAGVQLSDCVVWPGVEVSGSHRRSILTRAGTVQVDDEPAHAS